MLPPDYMYSDGSIRIHKFNLRKSRIADNPSLIYVPDATEEQLAAANGLVRIWDAGKIRYTLDRRGVR